MVKLWIHKPGGAAPFLVTQINLQACVAQFDLTEATFLQPLWEGPPTAATPGPLVDDLDPELVIFEVLADEDGGPIKPGYYASKMTASTVLELIGEE